MRKVAVLLITAVLALPRQVGALLLFVRNFAASLLADQRFAGCSPTPAELATAADDLERKEQAADSRTRGAAQSRDEQKRVLQRMMRKALRFVQNVVDDNPADPEKMILALGLKVKQIGVATHDGFEVRHGKNSGEVTCRTMNMGNRTCYEWQYSTDGKGWTSAPTTVQSKTVIRGLTPRTTYYFRTRTITKAGPGDWSQVLSLDVI